MTPAIIWGLGNLGRAIVRTIEAGADFHIVAVVETDPRAVGRPLGDVVLGSKSAHVPIHDTLAACGDLGPATVFHATTSAPGPATAQILEALGLGHSVISAAEWLFHPWLRFGEQARALDMAARATSARVLGCGINPGFCFETLPILLARTVHSVTSVDIRRVSNVGGVGPADFAHLGFGLSEEDFFVQVAEGTIEGHMGFPESIAALAEGLDIQVDRMTDRLVPTLAVKPLALPHRLVAPGEVVGITQTATGSVGAAEVIRMTLEMFLDPEGYGRSPRESVAIEASRSFTLDIKPAAPPVDGAAAMMVRAAADLDAVPPGLVSLLDLPMGRVDQRGGSYAQDVTRSREGTALVVGRR